MTTAVLISSVSKKVPLIEAVRRAAGQLDRSTHLHGCDSDQNCLAQYFVDTFWHCPALDQCMPDQILNYCSTNQIQAIIPTRNGELAYYAEHREFFRLHGVQVMISPLEAIRICLDKKLFTDYLKQLCYPSIPTEFNPDQIETAYYVVKERFGAGSLNMGLKLSKIEALEHAAKLQYPLFQPYIEGQEYSVDLYRTLSGEIKGCIARRRDLIVNGESQITTTAKKPILEQLCCKVADSLQLYGHAVFQALETEDHHFYLIECNPRFGGASTASIAAGLETFVWFLSESRGLDLKDYPFQRIENEIRMIRYPADRMIPW